MDRSPATTLRLIAVAVASVTLLAPASAPGSERVGHLRLEACKEAKPDGQCGTVTVPLDYANPSAGTIDIFFSFFPHRASGPASSAILVTEGGPGLSVTQDQFLPDFYNDTFKPLMKTRDLILLDQRGVGKSGAIDCPSLQHGPSDIYAAVRDCGQQLGAAADLYGSDNIAKDIDAVRAALGIDKLDLYGGSAAAFDVQAYAARFPEHLRSAVLDSPLTSIGWDSFDHPTPAQWLEAATLICNRSQSCRQAPGNAGADIAWVAEQLRDKPLEGTALDQHGKRRHVVVTEGDFIWRMLGNDGGGNYLPASEVAAAAHAFRTGDPVPLLRLRAQNRGSLFGDEGKPSEFSAGDNFARFCTNVPFVWDTSASVQTRRQQWDSARAGLPEDTFAPFSIEGWFAPPPTGIYGPDPCVEWPAPTHSPELPVPPGAQLPGDVPALMITGDIDLSVPPALAHLLSDAWPNSQLVTVRHAGHHTATPLGLRFQCADSIIVKFIADLDPGAAACARKTENLLATVGQYPETLHQAQQAKPAEGDHSTPLDRKLATVAASTVSDAFRVSFLLDQPGTAPALRGGKTTTSLSESGAGFLLKLNNARFARDVSVDGHGSYSFERESIGASVHLNGPGGEDGRLRIDGVWFAFFQTAHFFRVHGKIGGREVDVRVPAT